MESKAHRRIFIVLLLAVAALVVNAISQTQTNSQTGDCADMPRVKAELSAAQKRLGDWPNLARYHDLNQKLAPPAMGENRVVFMGDSITDGWGPNGTIRSFPGKPYVNRGISGQTTPQMLLRFRPDVIDLKPKVVVFLAGTNDIAGNTGPMTDQAIEGNLASMAELAATNGIAVVFASIMPVSDYGRSRDGKAIVQTTNRPPERIKTINAWLASYVAAHKLVYLDYYSAMVDDKGMLRQELSDDGLHPNAKGYEVMAPLAEQGIQTALKQQAQRR